MYPKNFVFPNLEKNKVYKEKCWWQILICNSIGKVGDVDCRNDFKTLSSMLLVNKIKRLIYRMELYKYIGDGYNFIKEFVLAHLKRNMRREQDGSYDQTDCRDGGGSQINR